MVAAVVTLERSFNAVVVHRFAAAFVPTPEQMGQVYNKVRMRSYLSLVPLCHITYMPFPGYRGVLAAHVCFSIVDGCCHCYVGA